MDFFRIKSLKAFTHNKLFCLISINIISSVVIIIIFSFIKVTTIFVLGAIPIVIVGWLLNKRSILFTTIFILSAETLYLYKYGLLQQIDIKSIIPGVFVYTFFTTISLFLNKIRSMSVNIKNLNAKLLQKNTELKEISIKDHLTNLYNRRYVNEYLFEYAHRFLLQLTIPEVRKRNMELHGKVMILILADIDNFKQINDAYGHRAGDEVLVILAKQLGEAVRFDDIIIRWGGEEFLLICPLAQKNYVEQIIAKIMNNVRKIKYSITDKKEIHVTVSIGAIYYPVVSDMPKLLTFEQAIDLCDKALYESKKNGKNQARIIIPNDKYIKENKKLNKISVDSFFNDKKSYIMKEVY